jgi:hypothetical protein
MASGEWHEFATVELPNMQGVTRLAVSPDGKHIAMVTIEAEEEDH